MENVVRMPSDAPASDGTPCTAITCNIVGGLLDALLLAKHENRTADESRLLAEIRHHERGPECER